ncbi:CbiQ family ECF transporter T component [Plantibacter sp. YIM 135249]|uniref:CbiQ family ECF transporter T component n=1 Tax=Plantibacter sp. YIM 135249 TaxID=3423918 RepID=UPI003D33F442
MIALYRPGTSPLHRMPTGPKVLVVLALILLVSIVPHTLWTLLAAFGLVIVGYLLGGLGIGALLRQVLVVRWLIVITLGAQLLFLTIPQATTNTARVLIAVLLAALLTLTTRTSALLDATERALGPLRRFGVDPSRIGLLFAMTITIIPVIGSFATTILEAQRARGVPLRPQTFVVPLLVMSMKHADDLGDAMVARGIE